MKILNPPMHFSKDSSKSLDEKLQEVSHLYEKQFLREMMKAMRSTVSKSELLPVNQGEQIYRENLDNEYAEKWGDAGGIGLSTLIFDQLKQKFGSLQGAERESAPKGMFPLSMRISKPPGQESMKVQSPFSAVVKKVEIIRPEGPQTDAIYQVELSHADPLSSDGKLPENSGTLSSQFKFSGTLLANQGQSLLPHQTFAMTSSPEVLVQLDQIAGS